MTPLDLPTYFLTVDELAAHCRVSRDRVLYWIDSGLMVPAALVPKAQLPFARPGPSPYVVMLLDNYATMDWTPADGDMVAPLVGTFRGYQVERGGGFTSLTIAGCEDVLVSRSQLVVPVDQVEDLAPKRSAMRCDEKRTYQLILAALLVDDNDAHRPYKAAEPIAATLWASGIELDARTIANKIKDSVETFTAAAAAMVD